MIRIATKNYIRIPKEEYIRLKQLQKYFGTFWSYFEHLQEIKKAREEIKVGKTIAQEDLFQKLGL
ncbi:MAG: hypothetical protein G01um101433_207 [Parcubacteria group bacterium Gr01-1014_33]|nr:MAG: hypothetical protein G01um101433_207 [Parcubacteria group bacterium Gr01-1014_33]